MIKRLILTLIVGAALFSCEDTVVDPVDSNTVLMAQGSLYGAGDEDISQQNTVITDENIWNSLLTKMNSVNNETSNFLETEIDFTTHQAIAVFDEVRGNGGYMLELNVTSTDSNVLVEVVSLSPNGGATTVMSQPYVIVKILKSDLPIEFQ